MTALFNIKKTGMHLQRTKGPLYKWHGNSSRLNYEFLRELKLETMSKYLKKMLSKHQNSLFSSKEHSGVRVHQGNF